MTGICRRCGRCGYMHLHHVFAGSYRPASDRLGLVVTLCPSCHEFIHSSKGVDEMKQLQRAVQREKMEEFGWTVEQWISEVGKSWI